MLAYIIPFFHIATSTSPDDDFESKKFIHYKYFSYKNNFDKIFLDSDRILKSKCVGK